jgi:hypothetical protein
VLAVDAVLEALRVPNVAVQAAATEAIRRFPGAIVSVLIKTAACNRRRPAYCARLVRLAREIGAMPEFGDYLTLDILASRGPAEAGREAARYLAELGHFRP